MHQKHHGRISGLSNGHERLPLLSTARQVLVVDDHQPLLRSVKRAGRAFVVHTATTAEEAWRTVEQHDLYAAVIDVFLQEGTGLELVRPLRLLRPQLRIAMVSASSDEVLRQRAKEAGSDCFVAKPFGIASLLADLNGLPLRVATNTASVNLHRSRELADGEYVHAVLDSVGGNKSEAARRLGMTRRGLQLTLKKPRPLS
jgi:two-component system, response regulator RegA